MKYIESQEILEIPEGGKFDSTLLFILCGCFEGAAFAPVEIGLLTRDFSNTVKVNIKSRLVTVEGPRGTLSPPKSFEFSPMDRLIEI